MLSEGLDEEFLLKYRHVRLYKQGMWIPVRRPLNLKILRKIDEGLKPSLVYYTQGRFFRPWLLSRKEDKRSFFLYQDYIIVDMDSFSLHELERMKDKAVYAMFTGRGFHFCYPRPRFSDEEVADPELREIAAAKNNAFLIKQIIEERQIDPEHVDVLPEPRHLFKMPIRLKYGNNINHKYNTQIEVWGPDRLSEMGEMTSFQDENKCVGPRPPDDGAVGRQGPLGPTQPHKYVVTWDNAVKGTKAYVLFLYCSKSKALRIVEEYGLRSSLFIDAEISYLVDLKVINRERLLKILKRESSSSYHTFLKYKRLVGILKKPEIIRIDEPASVRSRGHSAFVSLFYPVKGEIGDKRVKLGIAKI